MKILPKSSLRLIVIVLLFLVNANLHLPKTQAFQELNINQANYLASLPLKCIDQPFPYKPGIVYAKAEDLDLPLNHHPAFYGCFDWHSAVHAHWSLVYLMKKFPDLKEEELIREKLNKHLTKKNIEKELAYFSLNKNSSSFERTYGWAWLLALAEELFTWDDPDAIKWYNNLKPLTEYISQGYQNYLPKLVYPIRVGEHSNTAFGISFAYDYAQTTQDSSLQKIITERAVDFYMEDKACPIDWEPSGYDFLSPCLQEIDIMRKVLDELTFELWLKDFLPEINTGKLALEPGEILDRTDGKLVHLDGLNFSRAWCLYPLIEHLNSPGHATAIANQHMAHSLPKIVDGDYSGEHWLASFALYAYKMYEQSKVK